MAQPQEEDAEFVDSKGVVRKSEFVRAIADALHSLGYSETGKQLEDESGISLHSSEARVFQQQILDGQWDESIATLHQMDQMDETSVALVSSTILERKYFELLAQEKFMDALHILRKDIQPLSVEGDDRVRELSSFILPSYRILPDGTSGQGLRFISREELLEKLKTLFPPSVLFPKNRLVHLVEQGVDFQNENCWYHNVPIGKMSLLHHQACEMDQIPNRTVQVLQGHKGEVWFLKFSHNGKCLASSCSDGLVIIWEVEVAGQVSLKHRLSGHEKAVTYISWHPDDEQLLTCGEEETVRRWDVASGECLQVYRINGTKPDLGLVSCEWAPDGMSIFSGVNDKMIILWDPKGKVAGYLPGQRTMRISDLCITSNEEELVTVCGQSRIVLYRLMSNDARYIDEDQPIVCCTLSGCHRGLLVSLLDGRIKHWNIAGPIYTLAEFRGHRHSRFVVRACFGGVNERFVASGSEDSQVYIWDRKMSTPISKLSGHTGVVNCVSWNPADPHMLASGSDDRTIRIWGVTPPGATAATRVKNHFSLLTN